MEERYKESFRRYEGAPEGGDWELTSLADDGATLTLKLGGQSLRWRSPVAYRVIDEGARLRQQPLVAEAGDCLVYCVDDSVFLEELGRLSEAALKGQTLTHYLVWTQHQCVDVVAASGPEID